MKRKDIKVFQLTHQYLNDGEIFVKADMTENMLSKLIKYIQTKAFEIEETYDLSPREMQDVLTQYKVRPFPNEEDRKEIINDGGYFDFIELDLYSIWEAYNIKVNPSNIKKFDNPMAIKMIKEFINEELDYRKRVE